MFVDSERRREADAHDADAGSGIHAAAFHSAIANSEPTSQPVIIRSSKTTEELRAMPTPTSDQVLRHKAEDMVRCYGISLWIRDGKIYQHGPGIEIVPPESVMPNWQDQGLPGDKMP
jgi:hypothetical protein